MLFRAWLNWKAIQITESQLADSTYFKRLYDHLYLVALYLGNNQYRKAIKQFELQITTNDVTEINWQMDNTIDCQKVNQKKCIELMKQRNTTPYISVCILYTYDAEDE